MSDVHGSAGADNYIQGEAEKDEWLNYFGEQGDDVIKMWQGQAIGGPGNDRIEQLASTDWWRELAVAYWDAPAGVVVDLQAGWAQDGWGTVDTLIGVDSAYSGWNDDALYGSATDNHFSSGSGNDTIDGRGGIDYVVLPWLHSDGPGTIDEFNIDVSVDGRHATITSAFDTHLHLELTDVERIAVNWDAPYLDIASFIDPNDMADQGLTAAASQRWNANAAMGTATTVSFSFVQSAPLTGPGATGFRAFTTAERDHVREILASVSAVTNLSFVEVADTGAGGQMRFGVSQQAATKGVSYAPSASPANATAGDVWMDVESMVSLAAGSEGMQALLHEIGHALGLRHPRNVDAGDAWSVQWRETDDVSSLTVMTSTQSSDGLFRADWGPLDVAALRYLYGTKAINATSNTYVVGGADAQAERTIVDDGGTDTLDASSSAVGVVLDLTPGHRSSVGLSAQAQVAVDNLGIALGTMIESAIGSSQDDVLVGNAGNNTLTGGLGNDDINGGDGRDTAAFAGARADYALSESFGYRYVTANDGTSGFDVLSSIERLKFSDVSIAYDVDGGNAGLAVKLLGILLPAIAANTYYRGVVLSYLDGGGSVNTLIDLGLDLVLGPNASNQQVVTLLYTNLVGFAPDAGSLALYSGMIDSHALTKEQLTLLAADVSLNLDHIGYAGIVESGLVYEV
ncbi:matrixin family metalloprotease [Caenimonas koreensis DSM 17982]|uniref:Matrixin family metalloprotease n=1 Tax=Caenimonas koreensis DSM 17982 TaxID=1121255 RepID=A0A844AQK7_9BURK|nr:M10 family metallopeptidase [Caenimonas koreensis]MRD46455.1 matrixin family metalloprotease [Caenimonas koreensis DSM 17982]